jgi:Bacterial virulence protein (VirJ)
LATRRSSFAVVGALLAMCASGACAARARPIVADRPIALNGHLLRLHFANANRGTVESPAAPLLVFATGDGGMHRKDLDAYRHLVALGYPIVGFDAHDYVTHLGHEEATTPARLATDYERIIDTARHVLHLDAGQPVVLVGVSRGAGLSVVAAGHRTLRDSIAGVVAVALTQEEEYVHWYRRIRRDGANPVDRPAAGQPVIVEVYKYLPRLGDMPIAVIQSTRDNYLPAAAARAMFGPDTPNRRFQAIDARNHSFRGARSELYDAMRGALAWVAAR